MSCLTYPLNYFVTNGNIIVMKGEELKKWRATYHLTQRELAQHLKVERVTVARWEVGLRVIPSFLFLALEALEIRFMKGGDQQGSNKS